MGGKKPSVYTINDTDGGYYQYKDHTQGGRGGPFANHARTTRAPAFPPCGPFAAVPSESSSGVGRGECKEDARYPEFRVTPKWVGIRQLRAPRGIGRIGVPIHRRRSANCRSKRPTSRPCASLANPLSLGKLPRAARHLEREVPVPSARRDTDQNIRVCASRSRQDQIRQTDADGLADAHARHAPCRRSLIPTECRQ